jgi:hypothetical protein
MSLVKLTIVELDNIWHDDQLEESGKNISAELHPKVFMIQRNLETSRNEFGES